MFDERPNHYKCCDKHYCAVKVESDDHPQEQTDEVVNVAFKPCASPNKLSEKVLHIELSKVRIFAGKDEDASN